MVGPRTQKRKHTDAVVVTFVARPVERRVLVSFQLVRVRRRRREYETKHFDAAAQRAQACRCPAVAVQPCPTMLGNQKL